MLTWVLQTDIFNENLERLQNEIVKQGYRFELVKYIPMSIQQNLPNIDDPVIFYGSLNLASKIKKTKNWTGIWCDLKKMECTSYYPYYGKYLLNSEYRILPWGEIDRLRDILFVEHDDIFIRPNSGYKIFSGGLLNRYESLSHFLVNRIIFPEELVVITTPKQIGREWRLIVCGDEIIASSQYQKFGLLEIEEGCPDSVLEFGKTIIKEWTPESCFVLDICEYNRELKLVEINSFSCSGFYNARIDKIVECASSETLKQYKENLC